MSHKTYLGIVLFGVGVTVAGCAELQRWAAPFGGRNIEAETPRSQGETSGALGGDRAVTPETLDQTTQAERTAALGSVSGARALGRTVASLGSPAEPGFWLKTPLVKVEASGQVRNPATGRAVAVRLIPIDGPATAGSRISLAAMRLLEVNLADLVTVEVFR